MNMKKKLLILLKIASPVFLLDQASKWFIVTHLAEGEKSEIIPRFFDLVHVRNPGAAFGTFASMPESFRLPFFYLMSFVALGVILIYFIKLKEEPFASYANLSLIFGGAVGNIFDRVFRKEVVDFLSFHWDDRRAQVWNWRFKLEWPSFNVADSAITIGVIWLMLMMLRSKKPT